MAFIDQILHEPSYGWKNDKDELIIPSTKQLIYEAISRLNIFKTKKNWISSISWIMVACMIPFFVFFMLNISWGTFFAFLIYAMIIMSVHGTIWFHRYCTHKSFEFSHPIWKLVTQNLVVKTFPEEVYVISHHVHHVKSDQPGDPYNAQGGFLYCMLSDVNHQSISRDFSRHEYDQVASLMKQSGVSINSYKSYQKWGSVTAPLYALSIWIINWFFWYTIFCLIGGHAYACAFFSGAMFWFVLVRAFNYNGHGKGKERHKEGIDFDRSNLSINQTRTGWFSGEWHNNHHLYPGSARSGFLPYQLDIPWIYIYLLQKLGAISSYRDSKQAFLKKHIHKK